MEHPERRKVTIIVIQRYYYSYVVILSPRHRLGAEYLKQTESVLKQWETELEKTKVEEEKLHGLLKQQQKLFQQQRAVQTQSLKTIKKLHEQYTKARHCLLVDWNTESECGAHCRGWRSWILATSSSIQP